MSIDVSAIISAFSGGPPPVVLGPVTFQGLEVPQEIPFGGAQALHVHKLPGGARVIDSMGRDDMDLAWSGYLEGPTALQRALALDAVRTAGQPVTLTWDSLTFTVLVGSFKANYRRHNWIPYSIKCVVQQDNSATNQTPQTSLLSSLGIDLNSALSSVLPIATTVSSAVTAAQLALSVAGAVIPGSAGFRALQVDMVQAQGAANDVVSAANGQLLPAVGSAFGILGQTGARAAVTSLISFTSGGGNLAGALQQLGFINRSASNLASSAAPTPTPPLPVPATVTPTQTMPSVS